MNIKTELIKSYIIDIISSNIVEIDINPCEIADTVAINMLCEIQKIIMNEELSDFEVIEEIISVFEKNKIDFGSRHDF